MEKKLFFVTFGQRSPFRDGWVEICATSKEEAHVEAVDMFGMHWSNMYEEDQFDEKSRELYPDGRIGRIIQAP